MLRAIFKPRFGAWSAADVAALPLGAVMGAAFGSAIVVFIAVPALFLASVIGGMQVEEPADLWRDK